jgi:formylglycine-generating enzyme required for sulfatase activity
MRTKIAIVVFAALALAALAAGLRERIPGFRTSQSEAKSFADCSGCPEMVVIPAGEFVMGSPITELYRGPEEQHKVEIKAPFALGKYEVTFAQWDACVADGGCGGHKPDDQGWGRENRPVVGVSWHDANAYTAWLSKKTGQQYRLPSEAEWEYAARAGTTTAFSFGPAITAEQANYDGSTGFGDAPAGANRQQTLPAGSFPANGFGLYDMHGNVWEWIEDCWSDEYSADTPADGRPYLRPNCGGHVMRGGSWEDYAGDVRSAARVGSGNDEQSWADGFRVARLLP